MLNKLESSSKKNIKIGIIISYVVFGVNILSHIFYTPFLLSKVGDVQYGLFSFVNSITLWLTTFTSAISDSYIKFATVDKKTEGSENNINTIYIKILFLFGILIFLSGIIIFSLFYSGTIPLAEYSSTEKNIIYILLVISIIQTAIYSMLALFRLFAEYKEKYIFVYTANLFHSLFNIGFCVIALLLGANIVIVALIQFLTQVLYLISLMLYSKFKIKIGFTPFKNEEPSLKIKTIISFSSFVLLSVLVGNINLIADQMILGFFGLPVMVAIYQLGLSFRSYLEVLSSSISYSFSPKLNKAVVEKDMNKVDSLFLTVSKVQLIVICLIVGGFCSCGSDFVNVWLGPNYKYVYLIAIVLLLLDIVPCSLETSYTIQRALDRHKYRSISLLIVAIANVLLSIILIVCFGKERAIEACLVGTIITTVIGNWISMFVFNWKVIKLPMIPYLKTMVIIVAIMVLSTGVSHFVFRIFLSNYSPFICLLIKGSTFLIIYSSLILVIYKKFILNLINRRRPKQKQ